MEKPVIVWFRKDLRLDDNHALHEACALGKPVIPIYIREPESSGNGPLGAAQAWWLHHSLEALDRSLQKHHSKLVLLSGNALDVLHALIKSTGAETVLWNRRYDPPGIAIDTRIKHELERQAVQAQSFAGQLLHEPSKLKTGGGTPYRVYTPFWRALEAPESRRIRWKRRRRSPSSATGRNRKALLPGSCCRRSRTGRRPSTRSGRLARMRRWKSLPISSTIA